MPIISGSGGAAASINGDGGNNSSLLNCLGDEESFVVLEGSNANDMNLISEVTPHVQPQTHQIGPSCSFPASMSTSTNTSMSVGLNASVISSETQKLYKEVRCILNKLSPQKFETLVKKFVDLPINTEERLKGVTNLILDKEKKKELQLLFEEKERTIRRRSEGNIRFIGELFKLGMLTPAIMYRCIEHLLSNPEEESLECLCILLTSIGKDLDYGQSQQRPKSSLGTLLNPYFQKMAELAQKRESSKVSSRVRFMLQDVIELRQNKWVPRREDNNPKAIEQIRREAERELMEMSIAPQQQRSPRINCQNNRQDYRKCSHYQTLVTVACNLRDPHGNPGCCLCIRVHFRVNRTR